MVSENGNALPKGVSELVCAIPNRVIKTEFPNSEFSQQMIPLEERGSHCQESY
jgi:hypothetical protein